MARYDFSKVRALIGEQSPILRKGIRHALFTIGFREIIDSPSFVDIHRHLDTQVFDLLVLNSEIESNDTTFLIREVRRSKMHKDPFLVVLLVVTRADEPHIKLAINSGADDILLVPFSPDQLMQRLGIVHERRKPFIVTHDYIGPDRRRNVRPGEKSAATFSVPNPYMARSSGVPHERYQAQLQLAQSTIGKARVASLAKAAEWEMRNICAQSREGTLPEDMVTRMYRLEEFCDELIDRLSGRDDIGSVEALRGQCRTVKNAPTAATFAVLTEIHDKTKRVVGAFAG